MPLLHVHFLPPPSVAPGSAAAVIDLLRASTTITRALDAGARRVIPCLEPADALSHRDRLISAGLPARLLLLGGERAGILIPGFDLDNSPAAYTPDRLTDRTLIFTTTNGTRALLAARAASTCIIACLNNLSAAAARLPADRDAHLVCAGTHGEVSLDDVLCAGALAVALLDRGFTLADDDLPRIALALSAAARTPDRLLAALRDSRGGRNLIHLGLDADITDCARIDSTTTVPVLDPDGSIARA